MFIFFCSSFTSCFLNLQVTHIYMYICTEYTSITIYTYIHRGQFTFIGRMDIKASLFIWKTIGKRIRIDGNRDKVTREQFLQREYRYRRELHRLSSNHQFMWSRNHNLSNTVASYTVHREAIVAPQKLKGLVSWTTHSGCHSYQY